MNDIEKIANRKESQQNLASTASCTTGSGAATRSDRNGGMNGNGTSN